MKIVKQKTESIYRVTVGDLQNNAIKRIGRKLKDDELCVAKKGVESGLSCAIDIILKSAIEEAVDKNI